MVIVGFLFVNERLAIEGEERLKIRFSNSVSHKIAKYGRVIIGLGFSNSINLECVDWFWRRIEDEFKQGV